MSGALEVSLIKSKKSRRVAFELDLGGGLKYHERSNRSKRVQAEASEQRHRAGKTMATPMN